MWRTLAIPLAILVTSLLAQQESAQLGGRVLDPGGAPVPNARITVRQTAGSVARATESGGDGSFFVPQLPPGKYEVRVEKSGFKTLVRSDLTLQVRTPVTLDLNLKSAS